METTTKQTTSTKQQTTQTEQTPITETEQTTTPATNQVVMTETEKHFVEELKAECSDSIEINKKLKEYEEERKSLNQKYQDKKISLIEYITQRQKPDDKIAGLFGATKKNITRNKHKLIELYNEMQTISKNAFDLFKLYDAKKIDEQTFEYLRDALNRKFENIKYVLDIHEYYFKPLYAEKMMQDYGIADSDFTYWSIYLFRFECLANSELFFCMYMERSLSDYLTRVEERKSIIVDFLAKYTDKPYQAVVF